VHWLALPLVALWFTLGEMGDESDSGTEHQEKISSLWVHVFRVARAGPKCLWSKKDDSELEEEIRFMCEKVINYRVKPSALGQRTAPRTVRCFCRMTDIMMTQNPELYTQLSSKLNTTLEGERVVCKAFTDFAEALFEKGITWPLIISLLTFSGALAAECSRNGRSVLVRSISNWTTVFMVLKLKEWIEENGNLVGFIHFVSPESTTKEEQALNLADRRQLSFDDVTRALREKCRAVSSKLLELPFDEGVHRITMVIGVLFVLLNVLWILMVR